MVFVFKDGVSSAVKDCDHYKECIDSELINCLNLNDDQIMSEMYNAKSKTMFFNAKKVYHVKKI